MKVAINCRSILCAHRTGIGRYTYHLIENLSKLDQINEYALYVQKKVIDFRRSTPQFKFKNFKIKMDYLKKGMAQTVEDADIYHFPSPDYLKIDKGKIVVTVHDLIYRTFPQGHTPETLETTDQQFGELVNKASRIICCSNNTQKDLLKFFKVSPERTRVIYQGVDHDIFYAMGEKEKAVAKKFLKSKGITGSFLLFVGTIEPRKNLMNLLKAFALLRARKKFTGQLAIVGIGGWLSGDLLALIDDLKIKNDLVFLGYVSDAELRYLYNLTDIFVFPSYYEGFGFPIIEAFSCATPVVTSRASSCAEIARDAALTVDPYSPEEIAEAATKILTDPVTRSALKDKGLKLSQEFSFLKNAQQTLDVYKELMSQ